MKIGVISDTHGLLRPQAVDALRGSDLIMHAGDIGSQQILDQLAELAPVIAIRGNCDTGAWAATLPESQIARVEQIKAYMIHDLKQMDAKGAAADATLIVSGHTHQPMIRQSGAILYVNPGSAGRRRFRLPVTLARLTIRGRAVAADLVHLLD